MNATLQRRLPEFLVSSSWFSVAVYFVTHAAFAAIERELDVGAYDFALLCPAAGLLAAILILSRRARWPLLCAAAVAAELTVSLVLRDHTFHLGDIMPAVAIPAEALAFAVILTVFLPQPWYRRPGLEGYAYIVVAAMVAPLIGAAIYCLHPALSGENVRSLLGAFGSWWASDLLGMVLVIPAILGSLLELRIAGASTRRSLIIVLATVLAWLVLLTLLLGLPADHALSLSAAGPATGIIAALAVSVVAVVWLSLRATPGVVAVAMMLAAILLNLYASAPGSTLAVYIGPDPFLLQVLYVLLITSAITSVVLALARFEQVHQRALSEMRRSSSRLVAQIATWLNECGAPDHRAAIDRSLESIALSCGADRCLVIEINEQTDAFAVTHRWLREGVADSSVSFEGIPLSAVAGPFQGILEGGSLFVIRSALEPGSPHRQLLDMAGARAAAYAVIRGNDKVHGLIVLSWLKSTRRWSSETSMLLQSAAQMIGSTISRAHAARVELEYREKLRELTAELARIDDQVRRDTAADLHDGAAQSLAIARMRVAQMRRNPDLDAADLCSLEDMIVTALSEIRGVIRNMAPASQFEFGIRYALREFVEQVNEQLNVHLSLTESGNIDAITGDVASLLYRATRELVTNAIKHADPDHIHIELTFYEPDILLRVTDDGSGIGETDEKRAAEGTGLGLFGLRERLRPFDGRIDTQSDERGTRIEVALKTRKCASAQAPGAPGSNVTSTGVPPRNRPRNA